jgi:hypothetical protein
MARNSVEVARRDDDDEEEDRRMLPCRVDGLKAVAVLHRHATDAKVRMLTTLVTILFLDGTIAWESRDDWVPTQDISRTIAINDG